MQMPVRTENEKNGVSRQRPCTFRLTHVRSTGPSSALRAPEGGASPPVSQAQRSPASARHGFPGSSGNRTGGRRASPHWRGRSERSLTSCSKVRSAVPSISGFSFLSIPPWAPSRHPPAKAKEELAALCRRIANHPLGRRALSGSLCAVLSDLTDKYIPPIWERRKYIHVEVTRVQRLNLKADECSDLLRLALLVRPAAYLHVTPGGQLGPEAGFAPVQEQALQRVLPALCAMVPAVPAELVRMGLRGALPFPARRGWKPSPGWQEYSR